MILLLFVTYFFMGGERPFDPRELGITPSEAQEQAVGVEEGEEHSMAHVETAAENPDLPEDATDVVEPANIELPEEDQSMAA